jgi:hypothetical protein
MNMYAYVGNDPVNMIDPKGEYALIGFLIGFSADAVGQMIMTGDVNLGKAFVSGLAGAATGGITSVYRTAGLATQVLMGGSTGVITSVGAGAMKTSMDGGTPSITSATKDAAFGLAGPAKVATHMLKPILSKAPEGIKNLVNSTVSNVVNTKVDTMGPQKTQSTATSNDGQAVNSSVWKTCNGKSSSSSC